VKPLPRRARDLTGSVAFKTSGRHAARVRISCIRFRWRTWSRSSSGAEMTHIRRSCIALLRSRTAWARVTRRASAVQCGAGCIDRVEIVVLASAAAVRPIGAGRPQGSSRRLWRGVASGRRRRTRCPQRRSGPGPRPRRSGRVSRPVAGAWKLLVPNTVSAVSMTAATWSSLCLR
jgi:hypothetical protein